MSSVSDFYRWTNRCSAFLGGNQIVSTYPACVKKILQTSAYSLLRLRLAYSSTPNRAVARTKPARAASHICMVSVGGGLSVWFSVSAAVDVVLGDEEGLGEVGVGVGIVTAKNTKLDLHAVPAVLFAYKTMLCGPSVKPVKVELPFTVTLA
jgi:hypothetical protein